MRMPTRLAPPLLALLLAACAGIEVNTQHDARAAQSVGGYRTYAWMPRAKAGETPEKDSSVEKSVDAYLTSRGYQRVEPDATPDFLLRWNSSINFQGALVPGANPNPPRDPSYRGRYMDPYPTMQRRPIMQEYSKGVLDLDIMDARSKQLVWRGTAQGEMGREPSAEKVNAWLGEAVPKLLADFPPQSPKG
jgi:hypothetical protein